MSGLCQCTSFDHQFSSLDWRLSLECRHKTVLVGNLSWSESSLFILHKVGVGQAHITGESNTKVWFLEWLGQVSSPSPILWSLTAGPGWRGGTAREPAWTIRFSRISVWHLAWSSCCWCSSTYSWYMAGSFTIICVSTFNPLLLTSLLVQATKYSSWI